MLAGLTLFAQPAPGATAIVCGDRAHLVALRNLIDQALATPVRAASTWFPDPTRERYALVVAEVSPEQLLDLRPHFTAGAFAHGDGVDPAHIEAIHDAIGRLPK